MYSLFAPIGTTLQNGITLIERNIRGYKSYGMLLSAQEAGIKDNSEGILELNEESKIYSYDDIILDFKPSFNRWDLHNVRGIARVLCEAQLGELKNLELCHTKDYKFDIPINNIVITGPLRWWKLLWAAWPH